MAVLTGANVSGNLLLTCALRMAWVLQDLKMQVGHSCPTVFRLRLCCNGQKCQSFARTKF